MSVSLALRGRYTTMHTIRRQIYIGWLPIQRGNVRVLHIPNFDRIHNYRLLLLNRDESSYIINRKTCLLGEECKHQVKIVII